LLRRDLLNEQTMTQLLKQAFDEVSALPPTEQDQVATWLLEELRSEKRWDALFASSQDILAKLADEAEAEIAAGQTEVLDPKSI
jgi:hypothetical protein